MRTKLVLAITCLLSSALAQVGGRLAAQDSRSKTATLTVSVTVVGKSPEPRVREEAIRMDAIGRLSTSNDAATYLVRVIEY